MNQLPRRHQPSLPLLLRQPRPVVDEAARLLKVDRVRTTA
jgi:hypothetical protein